MDPITVHKELFPPLYDVKTVGMQHLCNIITCSVTF